MSAASSFDARAQTTVGTLMSRPVLSVEVGETLWDAWQLLFVSGLRHLVVVDRTGAVVGTLSDRNILADVPATAEHLSERLVGDVLPMVPLVHVRPAEDPMDAARAMASGGVEAVPVLDDAGRLVGIVTESDIVRWVAA